MTRDKLISGVIAFVVCGTLMLGTPQSTFQMNAINDMAQNSKVTNQTSVQ